MSRLIDADALGMYLNYWRYGDFSDIKHEREYAVLSDVIEAVHHAPTVDAVERKRGRWEWNNSDELYYSCSCCGHKAYGNTLEITEGAYHYCPNCGADMRGEEE